MDFSICFDGGSSNTKRENLFSVICYSLIAFLILNFLIYSPSDKYHYGVWSINPIYDLLFLRSGGAFLYGNHLIVELLICFLPILLIIKKKVSIVQGTMMIFSFVFLHEFIIQTLSIFIYGFQAVFYQIFSFYILVLFICYILFMKYGEHRLQDALIDSALIMISVIGFTMLFYYVTGYHPYTLSGFTTGANIYDYDANYWEVVGWICGLIPLYNILRHK